MAVWAIGDVHGCRELLEGLWEEISPGPGDTVVLLGDLIDRGPDPAGVLWFVRERARTGRVVALRGNHEDLCLRWHRARSEADRGLWMANAGYTTLESYGFAPGDPAAELPAEDLAFLQAMPLWHREEGVVFVHAGLRPGVPLEEQDPEDLLWIRDEFYRHPEAFRERIVFGHTPFRRVLRNGPLVGIDTGAVYGGCLTAYEPFEERVVQVGAEDGGRFAW
ncbi:metallophosphoesterase family protein [Deferrisoma camini]|uniref:metallophosphoesterase family protein n=1 Tax=Deferrisoma camini TaxID=1035120 RepID=UPI00046CD57C|nr:metallophosphoesterase family protein [Deferrisoma camini]